MSSFYRVFMGEVAISMPQNPKILGTDGLISCIGFAGWDPNKHIAFLVHFGGQNQVDDFYSRGIEILLSSGNGNFNFDCAIRGGCQKTSASFEILEKLREGLDRHPHVKFHIKYEIPPSPNFTSKSLSVNGFSGEFSSYNIDNDLNPRKKTSEEEARGSGFSLVDELEYKNSSG
jgi:hypothetical protein